MYDFLQEQTSQAVATTVYEHLSGFFIFPLSSIKFFGCQVWMNKQFEPHKIWLNFICNVSFWFSWKGFSEFFFYICHYFLQAFKLDKATKK